MDNKTLLIIGVLVLGYMYVSQNQQNYTLPTDGNGNPITGTFRLADGRVLTAQQLRQMGYVYFRGQGALVPAGWYHINQFPNAPQNANPGNQAGFDWGNMLQGLLNAGQGIAQLFGGQQNPNIWAGGGQQDPIV